jgi:hypothetical protein
MYRIKYLSEGTQLTHVHRVDTWFICAWPRHVHRGDDYFSVPGRFMCIEFKYLSEVTQPTHVH